MTSLQDDNGERILLQTTAAPLAPTGSHVGGRLCCPKRQVLPLGSNYGDTVGLLFIGRFLPTHIGIGLLLSEVLGMGGTVAITAGLFLTAGFHAGVRSFVLHKQTLHC